MIAHATRSERAELARLALDHCAALLAFQSSCELADSEPCARTEARCQDARAALARAAAAVAAWCEGAAPESHGARRSSDRDLARELASRVRCRTCDGSGLGGLALLSPCSTCNGDGAA